MYMKAGNVVVMKAQAFGVRIVNMYIWLQKNKPDPVLNKQVYRSGTSIGANVVEAERGQSKADFYAKLNIALKEASETEYWLKLLQERNSLDDAMYTSMNNDCVELIKLLMSITKTQNKNAENGKS